MLNPNTPLEISGQSLLLNATLLAHVLWSLRISADQSGPNPRQLIERLQTIADFACEGACRHIPEYRPSATGIPSDAQRALDELRIAGAPLRSTTETMLYACAKIGYADCAPATITNFEALQQLVEAPSGNHGLLALRFPEVLLDAEMRLKSFLVHLAFFGITQASGGHTPPAVEAIERILSGDLSRTAERIELALKLVSDCDFLSALRRELSSESQLFYPAAERPTERGTVRFRRPQGSA